MLVACLRSRLKVVGNKHMSPCLDLPHCKDPHIAAAYTCAIENHFNALTMEDCSNVVQFKETMMAVMFGKSSMKKHP